MYVDALVRAAAGVMELAWLVCRLCGYMVPEGGGNALEMCADFRRRVDERLAAVLRPGDG